MKLRAKVIIFFVSHINSKFIYKLHKKLFSENKRFHIIIQIFRLGY
jgi:hypothetical protein